FICFLAFYLLVTLLGSMIVKLIKTIHLRWVDHLLGFTFGLLRGAILTVLVLGALTIVIPEGHPFLAQSVGYRMADGPLRVLGQMLPRAAEEILRERHEVYRELRLGESEQKEKGRLPFGGKGVPLRL
ncbi:MAG: CvpA family protein, partial [Candidatus Eisenbacteria sp.]|nr:CvpA family protein [Candidatus Eisenbacteria bacterium]